jgi:hypothetical protein
MDAPRARRPGETVFGLALLAFALWALWESHAIAGFDRLSGAGVFPMLASGVMAASALAILSETRRRAAPEDGGAAAAARFLLPPRLILFAALMTAFAAAIPPLGFLPAAGAFALAAIWLLWRRGPLRAAAVTALAIAAIWLVFRVVFQVVLPTGSLWR